MGKAGIIVGNVEEGRYTKHKQMINDAQMLGGIVIYGKMIKVHQNGVKIMLAKSYVSDGILDPEQKYTVIIVPEHEYTKKVGKNAI